MFLLGRGKQKELHDVVASDWGEERINGFEWGRKRKLMDLWVELWRESNELTDLGDMVRVPLRGASALIIMPLSLMVSTQKKWQRNPPQERKETCLLASPLQDHYGRGTMHIIITCYGENVIVASSGPCEYCGSGGQTTKLFLQSRDWTCFSTKVPHKFGIPSFLLTTIIYTRSTE